MPEDSAINRITDTYYRLTASEKKLANFVVANGPRVQGISISQMAEECGVAEATISRFCRKLCYPGFGAFKLALAGTTERPAPSPLNGKIQPEDSVADMCLKLAGADIEAITETQNLIRPESIQAAADAIMKADKVICMGQGGSMILAEEAAHIFSTVSEKFWFMQDSHKQASTIALTGEKDVLLFFSYSGSTKELMELTQIARERGAKIILVTRFSRSPGAAQADVVLQCGSYEGPLQLGSMPARMAQLFIVDVLYNEFIRRDRALC